MVTVKPGRASSTNIVFGRAVTATIVVAGLVAGLSGYTHRVIMVLSHAFHLCNRARLISNVRWVRLACPRSSMGPPN